MNQMKENTILFITDENRAVGFDKTYYDQNNDLHRLEIGEPKKVFYKLYESRDSWIDLQKTVQLKPGDFLQRIQAAINDLSLRIFDLKQIPETKYYDSNGMFHMISPFDGMYNTDYWLKRRTFKDFVSAEWTGLNNTDLRIAFDPTDNVYDAVISLNTLFHQYDILNGHVILFRNVKPLLTKIRTTGDVREQYDLKIDVFAWENLRKKVPFTPINRMNDWLILPRECNNNCFVIYNGVFYDYEVNETDKRKIKLKGITVQAISNFRLDKVFVHEFESTIPNKTSRKYLTYGIGNRYKNSVDFVLPIQDSMVIYNGVDNEFEMDSMYSIHYPETLFSIMHVSVLNFVYAINFMKG